MARNDRNLLELGGSWGYDEEMYVKKSEFEVNGDPYEVLEIEHDETTGLNVMTVLDVTTNEITIVYQGTNTDQAADIWTDALLTTQQTPPQYEKGLEFLENAPERLALINQQRELDGKPPVPLHVSYTAGNSLGGGIAAYVVLNHPEIYAVTLDPAPLPYGVEPSFNTTNYIAHTSPLFLACQAAGFYPDRFSGTFVEVMYGVFTFNNLTKNHVGYDNDNKNIPTGLGYDDYAGWSIWSPNKLAGNAMSDSKINVNVENLALLEQALAGQMESLRRALLGYLDPVNDDISSERNKLSERKSIAKEEIGEVTAFFFGTIENVADNLRNITRIINGDNKVQNFISDVTTAIFEYQLKFMVQVEELLAKLIIDSVTGALDFFVSALETHHNTIDHNLHVLMAHWLHVQQGAKHVHQQVQALDQALQERISSGGARSGDIPVSSVVRPMATFEESPVMKRVGVIIDLFELQFEEKFFMLKTGITLFITSALTQVKTAIKTVRAGVKGLKKVYENELKKNNQILNEGNPLNIEGMAAANKLKRTNEDKIAEMDRLLRLTEELKTVIAPLDNMWEIIDSLKPYVKHFVFSGTVLGQIQDNVQGAIYLLHNASHVFSEIWNRIAESECAAIEQLRQGANQTKGMIDQLIKQLKVTAL